MCAVELGCTLLSLQDAIDLANSLLPGEPSPDGDVDPRWQAIMDIGEYVESHPREVWDFVTQWGVHPQEDLRDAIAVCLLEHLLEDHFDRVFPRLLDMAGASDLFADMFSRCCKLGQAERPGNSERFDALMAQCKLKRAT